MLQAEKRQAIRANTTASGRAPPANATPAGIDAAIAAPGAMSVMLWNRTSRNPTASRLSPSAITTPGGGEYLRRSCQPALVQQQIARVNAANDCITMAKMVRPRRGSVRDGKL